MRKHRDVEKKKEDLCQLTVFGFYYL